MLLFALFWLFSLSRATYDLIDPTPRCYDTGYCIPYGKPGTNLSIHPNSEERFEITRINIARLYPKEYGADKSKFGMGDDRLFPQSDDG